MRDILTKSVGGSEAWSAVEKGEKGLVFTCGSGMTAAVGWLANEILKENGGGAAKAAIYDEVSIDVCKDGERGSADQVELDRICQSV